ncbi:hypothetical protein BDV98DRAFT_575776 [Pterulicium gracile]|uniref:Uncharacterized protein n=1 Tax=Pterulicium gracile TaxID=1884261 RepID=A0A5C3Q990_9AGAR|nr:hypothetical protein BDV98DRAFT_575776 [Pterula gracilis]
MEVGSAPLGCGIRGSSHLQAAAASTYAFQCLVLPSSQPKHHSRLPLRVVGEAPFLPSTRFDPSFDASTGNERILKLVTRRHSKGANGSSIDVFPNLRHLGLLLFAPSIGKVVDMLESRRVSSPQLGVSLFRCRLTGTMSDYLHHDNKHIQTQTARLAVNSILSSYHSRSRSISSWWSPCEHVHHIESVLQ